MSLPGGLQQFVWRRFNQKLDNVSLPMACSSITFGWVCIRRPLFDCVVPRTVLCCKSGYTSPRRGGAKASLGDSLRIWCMSLAPVHALGARAPSAVGALDTADVPSRQFEGLHEMHRTVVAFWGRCAVLGIGVQPARWRNLSQTPYAISRHCMQQFGRQV